MATTLTDNKKIMSQNPLNLAVRFILEITALIAMGVGGWHAGDGISRYVLAIALPLVAAFLWGAFRPPDEPHHPSRPLFAVPGKVRLLVEIIVFGAGAWGLFSAGATTWGWVFAGVLVAHYALSYDRVAWLVRN
jgi:hypothetical protein